MLNEEQGSTSVGGPDSSPKPKSPSGEVAGLFLKLGFIAFGGPAAHIALMRDEVVRRRRWMDDQRFLDLLGASNLIPGPTSTELAIYLGYVRAGWRGLVLAGTLFILPAAAIVLALAWAYVRYGSTPEAVALLYGVKPVIIAIILQALWGLGKAAVKDGFLLAAGAGTLALYLLEANPIALLFGVGILVMLLENLRRHAGSGGAAALVTPWILPSVAGTSVLAGSTPFSLVALFLTFLKIGAVVYGSGYVLLAFLRNDLVNQLGWLTDQQLIDAVAVGQFTPGPVFTTATFIGYLVGGLPGAALSTVGIFLPSFLFVAVIYPLVPRIRSSPWTSAFMDGVNVAALGLMAAVTWQLGQAAIIDAMTAVIAVVAGVLLIRFKVGSAWLIVGGAVLGVVYHLLVR